MADPPSSMTAGYVSLIYLWSVTVASEDGAADGVAGTPAKIIGALNKLSMLPCRLVAVILNTKWLPGTAPPGKLLQVNSRRLGSLRTSGLTRVQEEAAAVPVPSGSR